MFVDFDELPTEIFHTPNNYTHDNPILEDVFDTIPDIAGYDKIGIHLRDDRDSFFDGANVYFLPEFIARTVIDCVWLPENNIWFWCCMAGQVSVTQRLADITGTTIKAPDGYLIVAESDWYFVSDLQAAEMERLYKEDNKQFWNIADEDNQVDKWVYIEPYDQLSQDEIDEMYDAVLAIIQEKHYDIQYQVENLDDWWGQINVDDEEMLDNKFHPINNIDSRRQLWASFQL